jgi:hypothetical protein
MTLYAVICVLLEVPVAIAHPARPNHAALIHTPTPAERLSASARADRAAYLSEAQALGRFLDRCWASTVYECARPNPDPNLFANALTALEQFDAAVCTLNPDPTVGEALARVRVYRTWLGLIARGMERARANGADLGFADRMLARTLRILKNNYQPLFSRAV